MRCQHLPPFDLRRLNASRVSPKRLSLLGFAAVASCGAVCPCLGRLPRFKVSRVGKGTWHGLGANAGPGPKKRKGAWVATCPHVPVATRFRGSRVGRGHLAWFRRERLPWPRKNDWVASPGGDLTPCPFPVTSDTMHQRLRRATLESPSGCEGAGPCVVSHIIKFIIIIIIRLSLPACL